MTAGKRLDERMVERGLAPNIKHARALIMAGRVVVGDHRVDKSGALVRAQEPIRLTVHEVRRFASRAGEKLEQALDHFQVQVAGCIALDLGASTGGFTDCLLKRGAKRVFAVDVGTHQLDYRLRQDPRVVSLERTHAKELDANLVPDPVDMVTIDVSFTSLRRVIPFALPLMKPDAGLIALFKPQFEANRHQVEAGGLVRDPVVISELRQTFESWSSATGLRMRGWIPSRVLGRKGNQELLFYLQKSI